MLFHETGGFPVFTGAGKFINECGMKNFIDEEKVKKEAYEAPVCAVVEIDTRQTICTSGFGTIDPFEEEDYNW